MFVNRDKKTISTKHCRKDCNKKNANIQQLQHDDNCTSQAFLTNDNRYIIIGLARTGHNVYDIDNDTWLLPIQQYVYKDTHESTLVVLL